MMGTWINVVSADLSLPDDVNVDVILDVDWVTAQIVERPTAPVTAFFLGVAVAGGMDVNEGAAKVRELASTWDSLVREEARRPRWLSLGSCQSGICDEGQSGTAA